MSFKILKVEDQRLGCSGFSGAVGTLYTQVGIAFGEASEGLFADDMATCEHGGWI